MEINGAMERSLWWLLFWNSVIHSRWDKSIRVGVMFSPSANFMDSVDSNPKALGVYLVQLLNKLPCTTSIWLSHGCWESVICWWLKSIQPIRNAFKGLSLLLAAITEKMRRMLLQRLNTNLIAFGHLILILANLDLPRNSTLWQV